MRGSRLRTGLLVTTGLVSCIAGPAFGQESEIEEVVVTATRQVSTVNRVPLSIAAITQDTMDQQGVKTAADLAMFVPALRVTPSFGGAADFSIRGVSASLGAPTTGVYLDDTPLQKRALTSGHSGNGTPTPPLFDLQRVEVLRGPQGTLFGGSSQGGTIRFITPAPSLTDYSGFARAEFTTFADGESNGSMGYEGGVAVGGPIIMDKLGFRASVLYRHVGGYIDVVDPYRNGEERWNNANSSDTKAVRVAFGWAPTERMLITPSYYHSEIKEQGGPDQFARPQAPGQTYTTTSPCYDTRRTATGIPPAAACPTGAQSTWPTYIYQRPAATYGPFDYLDEPYNSIASQLIPARSEADVASVTFNYDFDNMNVKLISSYLHDQNKKIGPGADVEFANQQRTTDATGAVGFALSSFVPHFARTIYSTNKRRGYVHELRFSSAGDQRLTWVAGVFASNVIGNAVWQQVGSTEEYARYLFGMSSATVYGAPYNHQFALFREQKIKDFEVAGFGEGTYAVTERLRLIAGVRMARVESDYDQVYFGSLTGYNDPAADPRGITKGAVKESPISPKFVAQYQITSDDMVYVSAAKGYRSGGVNVPLSLLCNVPLGQAGLTIADIPKTYNSDTVWSYEGGGKARVLDGRMQVNASAYQIDWSEMQTTVNVSSACPNGWVANAGKARIRGFDVDILAKPLDGLTVNFATGYTDAEYAKDVLGPKPATGAAQVLLRKGDPLGVAPWQVTLGARYDFQLGSRLDSFVRLDYTYTPSYQQGVSPGRPGYSPDNYKTDDVTRVNLRAGVEMADWSADVFIFNLLNSKDEVSQSPIRGQCSAASGAACTTYGSLNRFPTVSWGRPREVGVQLTRRF